ncbi:MAG: tRNA (N(6)-L-threonylcarbamoyladenosine(37)-C(2))-methylthiotransferase MtaB [Clostridia bacterium]|nr:tRNA (N(6)-L-threonylcarbamoyladenosine(37)-C(2))-methylthiotransferase MtaB [Clostridia bacterium]
MRRVGIVTLGCKVNQYDSDALASEFRRAGYEVVPFGEAADVYVVNTCTVTQIGDKKSRQLLRRAHSKNPDAIVVATGCYAQSSPDELAALPGVGVVSGTANRAGIVRAVDEAFQRRDVPPAVLVSDIDSCFDFEDLATEGSAERTRAYIKIEDGCENFCSYCRVPYVRGPVRSRRLESITGEAERLAARGFREVILTGIDLGAYGRDMGGQPDLSDVMEAVAPVPGIARVRLSSVDPTDVTERLLTVMGSAQAVCPHLHVPLQSGHDGVLARMNRHYTVAQYEEVVNRARAAIPNLAVTTDVIVGFPGEDESAFAATMETCERVAFSRMHVFQYSRRKGTVAADLPGQVGNDEKARRSEKLISLGRRLSLKFHEALVGMRMSVLVEQADGGSFEGLTPSYVRVVGKGRFEPGQIVSVVVSDAHEGFVGGEAEEETIRT